MGGVLDSEDPLGDLADAAMVEHLGHDRPILGDQGVEGLVVDIDLGIGLVLDPEGAGAIGGTAANPGAGHPRDDDVAVVVGLLDLGDGADRGVFALHPGNQDQTVVTLCRGGQGDLALGGLDPEGDDHVREHHAVAEWQDGEGVEVRW